MKIESKKMENCISWKFNIKAEKNILTAKLEFNLNSTMNNK